MATLARMHVELIAKADQYAREMGRARTTTDLFRANLMAAVTSMARAVPAAAATAGAAIVSLAVKTGRYADEILDMAEQTGLGTDELQRFRAVAIQAGAPLDVIADAVQKMQVRMAQGAEGSADLRAGLTTLGISLTDSAGRTRDMSDIVSEAIGRLGDMRNVTDRNVLAIKLFGRGAAELAPVLGLGTAEMERMIARAEGLGLVMTEDALKAADKFREEWDLLMAALAAGGRSIVTDLLPPLTALVGKLTEMQQATVRATEALPMLLKSTVGPSVGAQGVIEGFANMTDMRGLESRLGMYQAMRPRDYKELGLAASDAGFIIRALQERMAELVVAASDVDGAFALMLPEIVVTAEGMRNLSVRTVEWHQATVPLVGTINETNFSLQRRNAVMEYGQQLTIDMMTAEEQLADTKLRLEYLVEVGAITQETANRAMAEAIRLTYEQAQATNELGDAMSKLGALSGVLGAFGVHLPFLSQLLSIGGMVSTFSGGFAEGGTIPSGRWGVVGERGPEIVHGPATVAPMGGGGNLAAAILSRLGPPPAAMSPDAVAATRYYRQLMAAMVEYAKHDGVRFQ